MIPLHVKHKFTKLVIVCLLAVGNPYSYAQNGTPILTILNWSDYIDPSVVTAFEQKYKVKINEVYYETDDARDRFLTQTNGLGYDVGIVSGIMMETYKHKGWIDAIKQQNVANLAYIDERKRNSHEGAYGYGVPYAWGTIGIAYRTDLVDSPVETWMDLLQPQAALQGKIVMIKSARELLGVALNAKGYSVNSMDKKELAEAEALLMAQKPHVLSYGYIQLNAQSVLVKGIAAATIAYSGDALTLQEIEPNIKYVLPAEGSSIWVDHWVVFAQSTNKSLAHKFLNFMNEPKIAAQNAQYLYMATPNLAATKFLSREFLEDPIIHPSTEQLRKLESQVKLQGRELRTRSQIFNHVVK